MSIYKNKEWLENKYWEEEMSISEIATECNVANMTIYNWMVKLEIPRRGVSESNKGNKNGAFRGGLIEDYNWVKEKCESGFSLREIAGEAQISKRSVARWLEKHGLETNKVQKNLKGEEHPNWTGKAICECGNKKNTSANICQECYVKILKSRKGPLSPTWKGIADIQVLVRTRVMPEWRRKVFERDGYTCMSCGDGRGGNLQAHHIKRFSVIVDEIIDKNFHLSIDDADDRLKLVELICENEEMLSIYNGVTLCEDCHTDLHKGEMKVLVEIKNR